MSVDSRPNGLVDAPAPKRAPRVSLDLVAYALLLAVSVFIFDGWMGLSALHPSHLEWLYLGDYRRNLAALNLFRSSSWQFPLGHIETSDFPVGANIVFMDGNLLLAIVTKLLAPFLGPAAQTYGAWVYLCALLQFWSIYWALRQLAVSSVCAFLGALLIGLLPTFYYRVGHLNLLPHFLIIIGWGTLLSASMTSSDRLRIFLALIVFSVFTHFYFTPPLVLMAVLTQWRPCSYRADTATLRFVARQACIILALMLSAMFAAGYFQHFRDDSSGFGFYSMNLNAFINPLGADGEDTSRYVSTLPIGTAGQYEGYQYLGLGLLLFVLMAGFMLGRRIVAGVDAPVWSLWLALTILSLSNQVYLGSSLVFGIELPRALLGLVSPFRASGRYGWFVVYPVLLVVFSNLYRHVRARSSGSWRSGITVFALVVALLTVVQFEDIRSVLVLRRGAPPPTLPAGVAVARTVAAYVLASGFRGPIFIDVPDIETNKDVFAPLTAELAGRRVSISPAPNVRENLRYSGRDHIQDTLDAHGLVITQSCERALTARKIELLPAWCAFAG
ncbi:DUF6311 domain-containing protein [Burkholderia sp. JPY481]|uniref:DUF6311 domain-containing protein n=1 Tax=Paraburkholderia sp. JPY465 TaxID=3042285 RepID=UPI0031810E14